MGEVSNAFVVAMGIGVVFVGLICIVVLCMVMSRLCRPVGKKVPAEAPAAAAAGSRAAEAQGTLVTDMAELTAVITAAITAAASDRPAAAVRSAAVPGRRVAAPSSYRPVLPPVYSGPPRHAAAAPVRRPAASKRQEMISAVSAAIAEQSGTDVSGIRILSFKKID